LFEAALPVSTFGKTPQYRHLFFFHHEGDGAASLEARDTKPVTQIIPTVATFGSDIET